MQPWAPKPIVSDDQVVELYNTGKSTRKVAEILSLSKTRVAKIVKKSGASRSKLEAGKFIHWHKPHSIHPRTNRQRARKVWTNAYGKIPKGYDIHHKDHDYTNNAISNLEMKLHTLHVSEHSRGPEYGTPRWLRPKRQEYMKEYQKRYRKTYANRRK